MTFDPPAAVAASWPRALRLVIGVWGLGFFLMLAVGFSGPGSVSPVLVARWATMAALGAGLCALAWRVAAAAPGGERPSRTVVLAVGLAAGAAAHVAADLGSGALLAWLSPADAPQAEVVSSSALMAIIMNLVIRTNAVLYLALYGFFGMAAAALITSIETRERDRRLAEALSAAGRAQLAALRLQLNPHFLFNTLNALGSLVVTGRTREAEAMIEKLSDFLRASLASDAEAFAPLEDELALTQAYLDIEAERFRDRMTVAYDCPPELRRALVPSFLLQPLVENAVKYAVAPALNPVTLRVSACREGDDLVLQVEDDGAGLSDAPRPPGVGLGLKNIRERLDILYGARASLQAAPCGTGFRAAVRLPFGRAERTAA